MYSLIHFSYPIAKVVEWHKLLHQTEIVLLNLVRSAKAVCCPVKHYFFHLCSIALKTVTWALGELVVLVNNGLSP